MRLIIDGNVILMTSIFVWRKNRNIPVSYYFCLQLFKYLKKHQPKEVYIVADGGASWRKSIYPEYKANRKPFRESFPDIPWDKIFKEYDKLLRNIQSFTPFKVFKIEHIEGDDIISYLCSTKDSNQKAIVVTKDKDLLQLLYLPNVEIHIPQPKGKVKVYNILEEDIVNKKIRLGDKSDNIPKATSFSEVVRNQILVDLMSLPSSILSCISNAENSIRKDPSQYLTFLKVYPYKFLAKVYKDIIKNLSKEEVEKDE